VPYLIDGHNLIGRFSGLSLSDPEDERKLLSLLERFANRARRHVVVFFDRGVSPSLPLARGAVEVHFVRPPRQADDALLHYLRQLRDPGNWTVVTSDREVAQGAASRGARTQASERFAQVMMEALREEPRIQAPEEASAELDEWMDLFGGERS